MGDEGKRAAAYMPWATFKNALDQLSKGMPSRIDRSVFPGTAWNLQNQLFSGLKFLGLVSEDDEPTPPVIGTRRSTSGSNRDRQCMGEALPAP